MHSRGKLLRVSLGHDKGRCQNKISKNTEKKYKFMTFLRTTQESYVGLFDSFELQELAW